VLNREGEFIVSSHPPYRVVRRSPANSDLRDCFYIIGTAACSTSLSSLSSEWLSPFFPLGPFFAPNYSNKWVPISSPRARPNESSRRAKIFPIYFTAIFYLIHHMWKKKIICNFTRVQNVSNFWNISFYNSKFLDILKSLLSLRKFERSNHLSQFFNCLRQLFYNFKNFRNTEIQWKFTRKEQCCWSI